MKAADVPDANAVEAPQTNGVEELAKEEKAPVSADAPEVKIHAEDTPAGDVIEKEPTPSPSDETSGEEVMGNDTTTEHYASDVSTENVVLQDSKPSEELSIEKSDLSVESSEPIPTAMPIERPTEGFENEPQSLENSVTAQKDAPEETKPFIASVEDVSKEQLGSQVDATSLSNEDPPNDENAPQLEDNSRSISEPIAQPEAISKQPELEIQLPDNESTPADEPDKPVENPFISSEDTPTEEQSARGLADELPIHKEIVAKEEEENQTPIVDVKSSDIPRDEGDSHLKHRSLENKNEEIKEHKPDLPVDLDASSAKPNEDSSKELDTLANVSETSPATEDTSPEEPLPHEPLTKSTTTEQVVIEIAQEIKSTSPEALHEIVKPNSELEDLSNGTEDLPILEKSAAAEESTEPEHDGEAGVTENEPKEVPLEVTGVTEHAPDADIQRRNLDLDPRSPADEDHLVVEEEPPIVELASESPKLELHHESVSHDSGHEDSIESSHLKNSVVTDHEESLTVVVEENIIQGSVPATESELEVDHEPLPHPIIVRRINEENQPDVTMVVHPSSREISATEEMPTVEQIGPSHSVVEVLPSPEVPPVYLNGSTIEDSGAACELPTLDEGAEESVQEAPLSPVHDIQHAASIHDEDESRSTAQDEQPQGTAHHDDNLLHEGVSEIEERDMPDQVSAVEIDQSSDTAESELAESSEVAVDSFPMLETPPSSIEEALPELGNVTAKQDAEMNEDDGDVYRETSSFDHGNNHDEANEEERIKPGDQDHSIEQPQNQQESSPKTLESPFQDSARKPLSQVTMTSQDAPAMTTILLPINSSSVASKIIETAAETSVTLETSETLTTEILSPMPSEFSSAHLSRDQISVEQDTERPLTPTEEKQTIVNFPFTPSRQVTHQTDEYPVAESPVTVLNADDLFVDDEDVEEDEEHYQRSRHEMESESEQDERRIAEREAAYHAERSHADVSEESTSWPLPSFDAGKLHPEIHVRDSGHSDAHLDHLDLDSDTVEPEVSAESHVLNDSGSEYENNYDDLEDDAHIPDKFDRTPLDDIHEEEDYQQNDSSLHIRTHTADTDPSFETYNHSDDGDSSPATPIDEIAERASDVLETERFIRSSWPTQSHHVESIVESSRELKSQASPMHESFDPFSMQQYPAYITPKTSLANMNGKETPESDFHSSPGDSEKGHVQETSSPNFPLLHTTNLSDGSPFSQMDQGSGPQPPSPSPSRFSRRPTLTDRTIMGETPTNSPSIPSSSSPSVPTPSFFQKTRSLFESPPRDTPQPPTTRPLSSIFNIRASGSPSPPPKPASMRSTSRPSSLYQTETETNDYIMPRSLDANPKPPSPGFVLPGEKRDEEGANKRASSFLGGLGMGRGRSGGLENSNPDATPLLHNYGQEKESADGY